MRARAYLIVAVLVIVSLAGCFGAENRPRATEETEPQVEPYHPPEPPEFDWASAIEATHSEGVAGHGVPGSHNGSVGMELLAFSDVTTGMRYQGLVSGQYKGIDVCGDMAVVGSFAGNRGFTLVNITNTSDIRAAAQFASSALTWDVRFSPDCQVVFVGMNNEDALPTGVPEAPTLPFTGMHDTGRGGVTVVDVSRPAYPERVTYIDMGTVTNLFSFELDNETYVVVNTGGIWRLTSDGDARTLEHVGDVPGSDGVHVARHPATGTPYLFTGQGGLTIFDISDPTAPEPVSNLAFADGHSMTHEQTTAPAMIDGRWILIGAGHNVEGRPTPFTIANITDPARPAILGTWSLPGDFSAHDADTAFFTFSPHSVAIRDDGRVALAHAHAGTWVIDVSTRERQEHPVTMGFALPDPPQDALPAAPPGDPAALAGSYPPYLQEWASPYAVMRSLPYTPFVWGGAWAADGALVVADLNSGVYAYGVP